MKNIQKTLFLLLLLAFVCSCTSDEQFQETSNVKDSTKVTAILSDWDIEDSRTSITTGPYPTAPSPVWVTGDSIGIYPDAGGDQLSFRINEGGSKTCSFDGGGWAMKSSSYTAYSPFRRSYYYEEKDALPISMQGQTQNGNDNADHLGAYDIQIAKGNKPEEGSLVFQFNRYVALVRLEIAAPKAATWASITLESDALFTTEATMNLALETPTLTPVSTSNSVTLNLKNVSTTDENLSIIAYMMLLPVDLTEKTLSVKLTDTDDNVYTSNGTITNNKTNFAANAARWIIANDFPTDVNDIPYLTFSANAAQSLTMSKAVETLEYSVNGEEWKALGTNSVTFGGTNGDLRLRGKNLEGTSSSQIQFGNTTAVSCSGDIRTLVNYKDYLTVNTDKAVFYDLFAYCDHLISAPELPATKLASCCYKGMFYGCTSLTSAPKLPATTLAEDCYNSMFAGCSSLTSAPELPATTLDYNCYGYMFANCTSLTSAPELPATTLAKTCYSNMFYGCTNLASVPELPATTLAEDCYSSMFAGCTSLTTSPKLPATMLAKNCYGGMFYDCIGLTSAPELPATTLTSFCYIYMFYGCINLTSAPILPSSTLVDFCYSNMFNGCKKITNVTMLATDISAADCLFNWLNGVSSTGTFIKAKEMVSLPEGNDGIPSSWIVKNYGDSDVEEIPNNQIWYTSSDGSSIAPKNTFLWGDVTSNNYENDRGVIVFERDITAIGPGAFSNYNTLTSIVIPNSINTIGGSAFEGCSSLTNITIPNNVIQIHFKAFKGCSSLTKITIPSNVTEIQEYAFSDCTSLSEIHVQATTPPQLGTDVFHSIASNFTIYVPKSSLYLYENANIWKGFTIVGE